MPHINTKGALRSYQVVINAQHEGFAVEYFEAVRGNVHRLRSKKTYFFLIYLCVIKRMTVFSFISFNSFFYFLY